MKLTSLAFLVYFLINPITDRIPDHAYKIDAGHTFITFEVKRFDMLNVVSSFRDISGTIEFNPSNVESTTANIIIKTESLESGNPQRDNAIKSPAFLNVQNYPEIRFVSTELEVQDDHLIAIGELTIHGVTKVIELPLEITGPQVDPTGLTAIAVQGEIAINRQHFGLNFDKKLENGAPFIGNEVMISINALAIKQ